MPKAGIILKIKGAKPATDPEGFSYVRSLRSGHIYKKITAAKPRQADLDDLVRAMGELQVEATATDDLEMMLAGLTLGGARRNSTRKSSKLRKKTHRRRRHH